MFNTIYSVLYNEFNPFQNLGRNKIVLKHGDSISDGNSFLILHGGADISPLIYQERANPKTEAPQTALSFRDKLEIHFAKKAIEKDIPIMAICRGAQLMCCLNGGKLIQDVDRHAGGDHEINLYNGTKIFTNSIHHQMMFPWFTDYELLAWTKGRATRFEGPKANEDVEFPPHAFASGDEHDPIEPEIVWFPRTKTLAVQGHPEWADRLPQFQEFVVKEFMDRCK